VSTNPKQTRKCRREIIWGPSDDRIRNSSPQYAKESPSPEDESEKAPA
jgi:hypothetical protein